MLEVVASVVIGRPQREVFDFLADAANDSRWVGALRKHDRETAGPVGVGTRSRSYASYYLFLGITAEWRVVTFEPPRSLAIASPAAMFPTSIEYTLDTTPEGTRVEQRIEPRFDGIHAALAPVAGWVLRRRQRGDLARLKQILEVPPSQEQ